MEQTTIAEEAKSRIGDDLVQEAAPNVTEEPPQLEPLPQFSVGVPAGWKDALYDEQH